jgi:hypothetical protein
VKFKATSRHIIPVGDLIDHEVSDDCVCGPQAEPISREDGSMNWLYVHHSLDGREKDEADATP